MRKIFDTCNIYLLKFICLRSQGTLLLRKFFFLFRRKIALVIILTRAGLNLDPKALKAMKITLPKMDLIPWTFEVVVLACSGHYLLGLPWIWGFLLGSIVAAVSPAVVVPCLFKLRSKGYGVDKVIISFFSSHRGLKPNFFSISLSEINKKCYKIFEFSGNSDFAHRDSRSRRCCVDCYFRYSSKRNVFWKWPVGSNISSTNSSFRRNYVWIDFWFYFQIYSWKERCELFYFFRTKKNFFD